MQVWDVNGQPVQREAVQYHEGAEAADKGEYRHFMLAKSTSNPRSCSVPWKAGWAIAVCWWRPSVRRPASCSPRCATCRSSPAAPAITPVWWRVTGWKSWPVSLAVEVASEFRYRKVVVQPDTLFVTISQSGETADTLAALRNAKQLASGDGGYLASPAICNVGISSLVRESDLTLLTQAGPEIGVASTKAFTTQLVGLMLLTLALGHVRGSLSVAREAELVDELRRLPTRLGEALAMDATVEKIAEHFAEKHHTLFLGRGAQYPVAMEGAQAQGDLYIHAEAYPAGELKHGPLALVDADMPVVTVAPNNELLEKLKSNLQEVRARGGELIVFADREAGFENGEGIFPVNMPHIHDALAPILYTLPLQLLSYYVAVLRGTDVDQPRNPPSRLPWSKAPAGCDRCRK